MNAWRGGTGRGGGARGRKADAASAAHAAPPVRMRMGAALALALLLLCAPLLHAQTDPKVDERVASWNGGKSGSPTSGLMGYLTGTSFSPPLMAALAMVMAMGLLYMTASFLQSQELTQFVKSEMAQAFATVVIVMFIIALFAGLDTVLERVASGVTSPCIGVAVPDPVERGLVVEKYAYCYISNLYDLCARAAKDSLAKGVDDAADAYANHGAMTTRWYLLYSGFSMRPDAHKRLDSEIGAMEFDLYQRFMVSLAGQRYFLQTVGPNLGAAALLLGVLLRALFYTRRLGGLLMAVGLGLLLVWPATYLLAWTTLNVSVYGQQAVSEAPLSTCPASCRIAPPAGYRTTNDQGRTYDRDTLDGAQMAQEAARYSTSTGDAKRLVDKGIQTCYPSSSTKTGEGIIEYKDSQACPSACRFYPTPADCDIAACAKIPPACKAIRAINTADPADDCTGGVGATPGAPNSDWQCSEKQCPAFCKRVLPQVRADASGRVVPSANAEACGKDESCVKCSNSLRRYAMSDNADPAADITAIAASNEDCKKCMESHKDGFPDCMEGIPALLTGTCDGPAACGVRMDLEQWLEKGKPAGICPTDCRVDGMPEKYQDKNYREYCVNNPDIAAACRRCPGPCKIPAPQLGASGDRTVDSGAVAGLSQDIKCAEAPTYDKNGNLEPSNYDQCRLCPLSCRFSNLPPLDPPSKAAYLSKAHYSLTCEYNPDATPVCDGVPRAGVCAAKLVYGPAACPEPRAPAGWLAFNAQATTYSAGCGDVSQIRPPACAPATQAYLLAPGSDPLCPGFMVDQRAFSSTFRTAYRCDAPAGTSPMPTANVLPNTDASAECSTPTALKYCNSSADPKTGQTYCPLGCKVDRQVSGPFFCALSAAGDPQAAIIDNANRCAACAKDGNGHTLGPQCQVLLMDEKGKQVLFPRGCDDAQCAVGAVDKSGSATNGVMTTASALAGIDPTRKPLPACNGFCFPRLEIPGSCAAYSDTVTTGSTATGLPTYTRPFASGAACPLDCRYDYNQMPPTANLKSCGYGFTSVACQDCQYATDTIAPLRSTCQDAQHYNSCSVSHAAGGRYWFKADSVLATSCAGTETTDPCKTEIANRKAAGYTHTTGPIYDCSVKLHKYPSLDTATGRRECGDLSMGGANPKLALCDASILADVGRCKATYDATTVACQSLNDAFQGAPAPGRCLHCPLFCRASVGTGAGATPICASTGRTGSEWDRGGGAPACGSPAECDLRTKVDGQTPVLPGFCGVDSAKFNLKPAGSCQLPNEGYGAGCPARCRVLGEEPADLPKDCQSDEVRAACEAINLPIQCRAAPPSRLCQGCIQCQTDCTAKPLVRQNCAELCLPSDFTASGRSEVNPSSLVSAMGGAAGNTSWRNLGNMAIPVVVLPIFCILLTLAFVRVLSPILGGDIELPGLFKLI